MERRPFADTASEPALLARRPKLESLNAIWLGGALVVIVLLFIGALWAKTGSLAEAMQFIAPDNFEPIFRQTAIVGVAALGMTFVIILGGIDLSVGSVIAFGAVTTALVLRETVGPPGVLRIDASSGSADIAAAQNAAQAAATWPWIALAGGVIAGMVCGLASGALITSLRMMPFVVTLGMLGAVRGLTKGVAGSTTVNTEDTWLTTQFLGALPNSQRWQLFPPGVWLFLALAAISLIVLRLTVFGRRVLAIGSNEQTARLCGVPVIRVKVMVYTLMGAFAGLAGVMNYARLGQGSPTEGVGLELDVIAAVVIGGGSLSGGQGSVIGSVIGALMLSVLRNGCTSLDLQPWVQEILVGVIIIAAVAVDRLRQWRRT